MRTLKRRRYGFTLIELLVVIAIMGILMALLAPAVMMARESARRTQCKNNLRQIGMAVHMYHDSFGKIPPGWVGVDPVTGKPWVAGLNGWAWGSKLLPFLEATPLYNRLDFSQSMMDPKHVEALVTPQRLFGCPSDIAAGRWTIKDESGNTLRELATSSYVGCFGSNDLDACEGLDLGRPCLGNGVFYHNSSVGLADVKDGLSNTFFVGERLTNPIDEWFSTWTGFVPGGEEAAVRFLGTVDHPPNSPEHHFDDFSSRHTGGAHLLLGDGSVRFVGSSMDGKSFRAQGTRFGSESVE